MPGVVSHATDVVEHPELVAERIRRFADAVGAERVLAGTDCGFGGRLRRNRLGEAAIAGGRRAPRVRIGERMVGDDGLEPPTLSV